MTQTDVDNDNGSYRIRIDVAILPMMEGVSSKPVRRSADLTIPKDALVGPGGQLHQGTLQTAGNVFLATLQSAALREVDLFTKVSL